MKLSLYICDLFRVRNYFFNMDNILFWAIITILVTDFGFERYLSYLNIKSSKNKLPKTKLTVLFPFVTTIKFLSPVRI